MAKTKARRWGKWKATDKHFDQGGQGQIYRVTDSTDILPGVYVLKELKNPKRSDRFENEIKAINSLTPHPNVVSLVDSGVYRDKDKPAYVMPEADMALDKYLATTDLSVDKLLELFLQILAGVQHIHSAGIIHRDIKPENILIFSGIPKVSDLGLCLIAEIPRVTDTNEAVGPRYYMAPELEDGRHPDVTLKADVYSLGKLMYFMLSKSRKVFSREKFLQQEWSLESQHNDDRFSMFNSILHSSVTAHPRERYNSLCKFIEDLVRIRQEFALHPGTTLRDKIPKIQSDWNAPAASLSLLSTREWKILLEERERAKAPFSQDILDSAYCSLSREIVDCVGIELLRHGDEVPHCEKVKLARAIVLTDDCKREFNVPFNSLWNEIFTLAIESGDQIAIKRVAISIMASNKDALALLASHLDSFEPKEMENFLLCAMRTKFALKEEALLAASTMALSDVGLGLCVAGLSDIGSPNCIQRIAELLRALPSIDKATEFIQGLSLTGEKGIYNELLTIGGFNEKTTALLKILDDIHVKVTASNTI
jgi:serine/threonine protein kinase